MQRKKTLQMMPERQSSDQINLNLEQPENHGTFTSKTQENHGLPTHCYIWPTLSFSNELGGQTFLIAENRGRLANSTAKSENRNENESNGLCAKSRRAVDGGVFRVKKLKIYNFELCACPNSKC